MMTRRIAMDDPTHDDEVELAAFICEHVFERTRPILLAVHDDDGDWQFMCGYEHTAPPRVVGLHHITDADRTVRAVMDMPLGWLAEREAAGTPWTRMRIE
jgi:hypothetical protein